MKNILQRLAFFPPGTSRAMLIRSASELVILQDGHTVGAVALTQQQCDAIQAAFPSAHAPHPLADFHKVLQAIPVGNSSSTPTKRPDIVRFGRC